MQSAAFIQRAFALWTSAAGFILLMAGPLQAQESELNLLNQKAQDLYRQGDYKQATTVAAQALAVAEKSLGPDHPDVAGSLNSLANAYRAQGRYAEAEALFQRALLIQEKALGQDHAEVAFSMANLAQLYIGQGRHAQAEPLLKRALSILEKSLGPEHPDVAEVLNRLAELHVARTQYAQAEPLLKRGLAIREKALGLDHQDVATTLGNLAELHRAQGQYVLAESLYQRALAISEKTLGLGHPNVATILNNLAQLYVSQGQYAQAEPMLKRALAIREKAFGPDHLDMAATLVVLALLYQGQGKYEQAEPLIKRSLTIWEAALGPDHSYVALALNNLANLYKAQGQYELVEPLLKRALAIIEKNFGPDHAEVGSALNGLAELYRAQGQYAKAEPVYRRSQSIVEKAMGPDHPNLALSLNNLALLYGNQGEYVQAEASFKRALSIIEKALGPDHPTVAMVLGNYAELYRNQGRFELAEPLQKRTLDVVEKALGPDHPTVALSLNNLALVYSAQNKHSEAAPLLKRSLAILEKALGPDHPDVAANLGNVATNLVEQGQYAQAEPLLLRSLAIREKVLGLDHVDIAVTLNNLARLYARRGQPAQGEPLLKRALAIAEKALGSDHPNVAVYLNALAGHYEQQGRHGEALLFVRKSTAIHRKRIVAGGTSDSAIREAIRNRRNFFAHLLMLSTNPNKEPIDQITDESLQLAQLANASGTASAIAKMTARFVRGDDALAGLIKRKQDAGDRRDRGEAQLVIASGKPPAQRSAEGENALRADIVAASKEIESIDNELARRFPEYQELTRPEPATVNQVRALLKPGEAMLVFSGFTWVIRQDGAVFLPLIAGLGDVKNKVAKIRAEMEFDASGSLGPVSVQVLHDLYQSLFVSVLPHLDGIKHLMIVTTGPLQSLPFSMLVASKPPEIKSDEDYRQVDWLAKHYAISVLPSVGSIQAFRQFAKLATAQEPFAGFGDPIIGEPVGVTRSARTPRAERGKTNIATLFRKTPMSAASSADQIGEVADVDAIRNAPRLPETADELRAIADVLKADRKSLWLQENATETKIKQLDLSKYRTIAFATHGVMAGEIQGIGEPGLILTPPAKGSVDDDGYLSAGEIAKLKLNADWVILSACNTAASDGTPGAEGLSGMAKAFFYAGARSLLVSHWPVASEATVPLTTGMLREYETNPGQGKAEAHRKAMLALMNTPDHPEYGHPLFWAPFVVVGEGGAGSVGR
jgi:tetratricopeptide (TPR) repeat protein/CHAT domain-containing protein